ncbi:MFS transporter [Aurantiacibacter gangjinensis]|uniref:Uncharacterized protein n=1 Tax=Aurantiacibacter gangjinensis TaxID=502682 RepID=A0A0G9MLB2_9SPHN|nr:MFS transporter [Aurantiacibacter gangjinensis]APE27411.1 Permeases of the major facilitator superfamily [Aurantiacibacter gangjinensis]KLE31485.1 hypothetical protein AAW01_07880 [Aurantiacibacter gangjinensis]
MTSATEAQPDMDASSYARPAYAWYALGLFVLTILLAFIDKQIISLIVEPLQASLSISDTRIGVLQGLAFSLFAAIAALPLGRLVDRTHRVRMLIICMLIWSTMTILCGFAQSFAQLFAFRVGVGIGEAAIMPLIYSLLADFFPRGKRATAMLVFYLTVVVCASLSVSLGGLALGALASGSITLPGPLADFDDWRAAFIIVGIPGPIAAVLIGLTLREPERHDLASVNGQGLTVRQVADYLAQRKGLFLPLVFGSAAALSVGNAINSWHPTIMIREFDWLASTAGIRYGLAAAICAGVAVPFAIVMEKRLRKRGAGQVATLLPAGAALSLLVVLVVPLLGDANVALSLGAGQLFGLYWIVALTPVLIQEVAPNEMRGQILALSTLISTILQGFSPVATGFFSDAVFDGDRALSLSVAATALPILVVAIVLYLPMRRRFAKEVEPS